MTSNRAIDKIIQEAIQAGAFDNLPGKGKPLNLDENAHVPPEWRMAFDMLQKHGFAPGWVELRRELEENLKAAREALARAWAWQAAALENGEDADWVAAEWGKAQGRFRAQAEAINKKIESYNLAIPSERVSRARVDADEEIKRIRS
jgi:DnaJ family protein C protein 28